MEELIPGKLYRFSRPREMLFINTDNKWEYRVVGKKQVCMFVKSNETSNQSYKRYFFLINKRVYNTTAQITTRICLEISDESK